MRYFGSTNWVLKEKIKKALEHEGPKTWEFLIVLIYLISELQIPIINF